MACRFRWAICTSCFARGGETKRKTHRNTRRAERTSRNRATKAGRQTTDKQSNPGPPRHPAADRKRPGPTVSPRRTDRHRNGALRPGVAERDPAGPGRARRLRHNLAQYLLRVRHGTADRSGGVLTIELRSAHALRHHLCLHEHRAVRSLRKWPAMKIQTCGKALNACNTALDGSLGGGTGKWRLTVTAEGPMRLLSLLESPAGHLTDLPTAPGGHG